MPRMVELVKERLQYELQGTGMVSFAIDGGSVKVVNGVKVIAVVGISPELASDRLLRFKKMIIGHENNEIQASFFRRNKSKIRQETSCRWQRYPTWWQTTLA